MLYFKGSIPNIEFCSIITIILWLSFDLVCMVKYCVIIDLSGSLQFDARNRRNDLFTDYSFYAELLAYRKHNKNTNSSNNKCSICLLDFVGDEDRQLLQCGHIYNTRCIQKYERDKWINNDWPYPYSKCPSCGEGYHIDYEKFNYNMHYIEDLPWYHQEYDYPGRIFMAQNVWNPLYEDYRRRSDKIWREYPYRWNTNYFGI